MNEINACFGRLYDSFVNSEWGTELINPRCSAKYTTFTAMCGHKYFSSKDINGNDFRFMLVGRAVNGWDEYRIDPEKPFTRDSFIESSMMNISNDKKSIVFGADRFEWIDTNDIYPHNTVRSGIDLSEDSIGGYRLSRAQIWSYTKEIWDSLYGMRTEWNERWFENIVWSNLYKIAPHNNGNPSRRLIKVERKACIDLLKAEINYFKPTHIFFATAVEGWFDSFSELFCNYHYIGKNKYYGVDKYKNYVEGTAEYIYQSGDIARVVIACRPEGRKKDIYTNKTVDSFHKTHIKPEVNHGSNNQ